MSSLNISKLVFDQPRLPKNGERAIGVVRIPQVNQRCASELEIDKCKLLNAGIRALHGQVCAYESPHGRRIKSIGVTSCYRGEGKSTIAAQLASVAAESRHVLLIDASGPQSVIHCALQDAARNGTLHSGNIGLAEMPQQPANGIKAAKTATESLRTAETRDLLKSLEAKFDLIIVDLPPLDAADVLEWAPLLDGTLLVIESERVRWQVAARGVAVLQQTGSQVLGTVINKRRDYIPAWLYRLI